MKRNDGIKIMLWTFAIFIVLAYAGIKIYDHYFPYTSEICEA